MDIRLPTLLTTFAALALSASGCARAEPLVVEDAWIRAAPPGAPALAGYATLRNAGSTAVPVEPCPSEGFSAVELHETRHGADGIARMRPLALLEVPAGGEATLAPGGSHLMLMGPTNVPAAGATVTLCLRIAGEERSVPFEVRSATADASHEHHHH